MISQPKNLIKTRPLLYQSNGLEIVTHLFYSSNINGLSLAKNGSLFYQSGGLKIIAHLSSYSTITLLLSVDN